MRNDDPTRPEVARPIAFADLYSGGFDFVWRNARRLGAPDGVIYDIVQDVFLVAFRRLPDFAGRSSINTWLFGILLRVLAEHRRALRRREQLGRAAVETASGGALPPESVARQEAVERLHELLASLDEEKRAVFVLAELEEMSVPEIAHALGVNQNTAYSRLRAARRDFERALARVQARDRWRQT